MINLQELLARDFGARQIFSPQEYFVYFKVKKCSICVKRAARSRSGLIGVSPSKKHRIANGKAAMRSWYQGTLLALSLRRHDPDQVHG